MYREIKLEEIKVDKTLGYAYFIDTNHPLASKGVGRVYYHRHIASIKYSKWLNSEENVHHIDGNKLNNSFENLVILSYAEHAHLHRKQEGYNTINLVCPICSKEFTISEKESIHRVCCSIECANKKQIHWHVTKEELEILIWNNSYSSISKQYPISDVGVKKRAKSLGCKIPPPYFFSKTCAYRKEQRKLNNIPDLSTQQSSKLLA